MTNLYRRLSEFSVARYARAWSYVIMVMGLAASMRRYSSTLLMLLRPLSMYLAETGSDPLRSRYSDSVNDCATVTFTPIQWIELLTGGHTAFVKVRANGLRCCCGAYSGISRQATRSDVHIYRQCSFCRLPRCQLQLASTHSAKHLHCVSVH